MAKIETTDDYFAQGCGRCARFGTEACSARTWAGGLADLRRICLASGAEETLKWSHPVYVHAGRNVAVIGAFLDDFRLTFFDASLLGDPEGVLERAGENSAHATLIRFGRNDGPRGMEAVIRAYMAEAMDLAARGVRPARAAREVELPDELTDALDADAALAEAFAALTPGRQRSWAIKVGGAKKAETRVARAEAARAGILAGKGALER